MTVIVTGGAGFIGGYVCDELARRKAEFVVVDPKAGTSILEAGFFELCRESDHVVHLAGVLGTSELFGAPEQAVEVNVKGAVRVLEACRMFGLGFTGITMPPVWRNPYSITNDCARRLATAWHEAHKVPVSHVTAFNAYGEGQKVGSPQKIIPTFSDRAWRGQPIPIWGDGTQTVDLVHARDVAKVLVDATAFGDDCSFDAGTGVEVPVNEVARMVLEATGSEAGVEHLPMRPGETEHTHISATGEGWRELGYQPEFHLEELQKTIEWYAP